MQNMHGNAALIPLSLLEYTKQPIPLFKYQTVSQVSASLAAASALKQIKDAYHVQGRQQARKLANPSKSGWR